MNNINFEYKIIGNGKTTLVIETGIGNSFYDWYSLIEEIKDYFTVIIYHRQGYGKSNLPISPRTTRNISNELNTLLKEIGVNEKYVILGHSFGGLCVQQYVKMYPDEIKAVVLVDSTSYNLEQLNNLDTPIINSKCSIDEMVNNCHNESLKSKEALINQKMNMISKYRKYVTNEEFQGVIEFFVNPKFYKIVSDEFANWVYDGKDIKSIPVFPDVPLSVIARDKIVAVENWMKHEIPEDEAVQHEDKWRELQEELALLSNQGKLIIASNSDHQIHIDRPDIIVDSLRSLS